MWVWGLVVGTEHTLILERTPGILIVRGYYNLAVSLNTNQLNRYKNLYYSSMETFSNICNNLTQQVPISTFGEIYNNMLLTNKDIEYNEEIIQSFFQIRNRRSFWNTFGLMDNGDKVRIDYDMDQLRQNEETMKTRTDHQTLVTSSIYDFVNKPILTIDKKSIDLIEKFQNLKNEVQKEKNFTDQIKEMLQLETELLEVGMWIQNFANHYHKNPHGRVTTKRQINTYNK